jgi:hypothetical protein
MPPKKAAAAAADEKSDVKAGGGGGGGRRDADDRIETETQAKQHEKGVVLNPGFIRRPHNRILVTGGAGFIGSHMCDFLLSDPRNIVLCVDNCFSGNKSNIMHHIGNPRFEFIRHGT